MEILHSCEQSMKDCLEKNYFSLAQMFSNETVKRPHVFDGYAIYYFFSGGNYFLINGNYYTVEPGSLFFINAQECHYLTPADQEIPERTVLCISPEYLHSLNTPLTNLERCFTDHGNGYLHKILLPEQDRTFFTGLIQKLKNCRGFAADIFEKAAFMECMAFVNDRFRNHYLENLGKETGTVHPQMEDILSYMHRQITSGETAFSVEKLADHFYLSSSYLARMFQHNTGLSIEDYLETLKQIQKNS